MALRFAVPARPVGGRSRLELLEGRLHLVSAYLVCRCSPWPMQAWPGRGRAVGRLGQPGGLGGVAAGLLVGKLAGVVGASLVAIRLGWGTLPEDIGGRHLWGLGALAGIGFTVALFVTDLAYGSVPAIGVDPAKLAILAASLVAGLLGAAVLFGAKRLPTEQPSRQPTDRP